MFRSVTGSIWSPYEVQQVIIVTQCLNKYIKIVYISLILWQSARFRDKEKRGN